MSDMKARRTAVVASDDAEVWLSLLRIGWVAAAASATLYGVVWVVG